MELAGKTGTAQDYSDAWFISYSPNLLVGTWVGAMSPEMHFNSAMGSGSALALPIAGGIWGKIEASPSLNGQYTGSFNIPETVLEMMACEPLKKTTIFDKLFERNNRNNQQHKAKPEKAAKEKSDTGKFFDKLFRKKKK
jgi:penicillin-binding protein 1A